MTVDFSVAMAPFMAAIGLAIRGWYLVFPVYVLLFVIKIWEDTISGKFVGSIVWENLMISIPKEAVRGPKVMEHFFTSLWSIFSKPTEVIDTVFQGKSQTYVSFELVGIDGHVRYIIRTPSIHRKHVESQIYAQYPDAEIVEVEDYTDLIPKDFLDKGYDAWGTEFEFTATKKIKTLFGKKKVYRHYYPIKTYPSFEYQAEQSITDPMSAFTEALSGLEKGEHIWYQLTAGPLDVDWGKEGEEEIKEIMGKYKFDPEKGGNVSIPEGEQDKIKAIGNKIAKHGFECKYRFVYIAKKEVFDKPNRVAGAIGPVQLFNTNDFNGFKPYGEVITKVKYWFPEWRQRWRKLGLVNAMRSRSGYFGGQKMKLNPEELATMYHFPQAVVESERIDKIKSKKASPPTELPVAPIEK